MAEGDLLHCTTLEQPCTTLVPVAIVILCVWPPKRHRLTCCSSSFPCASWRSLHTTPMQQHPSAGDPQPLGSCMRSLVCISTWASTVCRRQSCTGQETMRTASSLISSHATNSNNFRRYFSVVEHDHESPLSVIGSVEQRHHTSAGAGVDSKLEKELERLTAIGGTFPLFADVTPMTVKEALEEVAKAYGAIESTVPLDSSKLVKLIQSGKLHAVGFALPRPVLLPGIRPQMTRPSSTTSLSARRVRWSPRRVRLHHPHSSRVGTSVSHSCPPSFRHSSLNRRLSFNGVHSLVQCCTSIKSTHGLLLKSTPLRR